jgi:amino acid adenylation domain-containing protein
VDLSTLRDDLGVAGPRVAVVDGTHATSAGDVASAVDEWSATLRDAGIGATDAVVLASIDPVALVAMVLACMTEAVVFVPLDPAQPPRRFRDLATVVRARAVLTTAAERRAVAETADGLAAPVLTPGQGARCRSGRSGMDTDACYVFFTSGTTGAPKPIVGRRRPIERFLEWEIDEFCVGSRDRCSQLVRPTFDAFLRDALLPLAAGARSYLPPGGAYELDSDVLADWMVAEEITLVHATPSLLRRLVTARPRAGGFPSLRHLLLSGEALLGQDVQRWLDVGGSADQLVNLYGTTESTMVKLFHRVSDGDAGVGRVPIGTPITGAEAYVVDTDLRPVPFWVVGEVVLRTADLTIGYLDDPEGTAAVFVPNPFSTDPADLLQRTGDLGRVRPDGAIELMGRADDQVKVNGVRIEPAEVEDAARRLAGVDDCAVGTIERAGETVLCAWVVCGSATAWDEGGLRRALSETLPSELVPARVVFPTTLPVGPTGKLDRASLVAPGGPAEPADRTPCADDTERAIHAVFRAVLDVGELGVHEDFFALGGTSLRAARTVARLRRELGVDVPLAALFESPTVHRLATRLDEIQSSGHAGLLVALTTASGRPTLVCVHPAGGTVFPYAPLGALLAGRCGTLGIQAVGNETDDMPDDAITTMAARYVAALLDRGVRPPFHLLGWSAGGLIAYEMAVQLEAAGVRTDLLVLLDSAAPGCWHEPDEDVELLDDLAAAAGDDAARIRRQAAVYRTHVRARENYVGQPYEGALVLIQPSEPPVVSNGASLVRWKELAHGGVETMTVPGNHDRMLQPPALAQVALLVDSRLERSA